MMPTTIFLAVVFMLLFSAPSWGFVHHHGELEDMTTLVKEEDNEEEDNKSNENHNNDSKETNKDKGKYGKEVMWEYDSINFAHPGQFTFLKTLV